MTYDPSALPGKVLWLRAKDNAGANASSIATWADQSGSGRDATAAGTSPTVATASTPLGGKSVRFSGAGNFTLPRLLNSVAASSAIAVQPTDGCAESLFDAATTVWVSGTSTGTVDFEVATPLAATTYTLTSAPNQPLADPKDWKLQGSNDRSAWTDLHTVTGSSSWARSTAYTFTFSNSTTYRFYRLAITADNTWANVQVAGWTVGDSGGNATPLVRGPGEIWAVIKSDGTNGGLWAFGRDSGASDQCHYPYSAVAYDNFGLNAAQQALTTTPAITSWRILRFKSDGTTWAAYIDGTQKATLASTAVMWTQTPRIGRGRSSSADGLFFSGNIAEILLRSQISTTQEVSDITEYLTAEHFVAPPGFSGWGIPI